MAIPRLIHRIWFGPRDMPELYRQFGERWADMNPGWQVHDWRYEDLPPLVNQETFDAIGDTIRPNPGGAKGDSVVQVQRADIASYELLLTYGGLYLNCDIDPVRPLPDGFTDHAAVLVHETSFYLSNAFMAAEPDHPLMRRVVADLPARVDQRRHDPINEVTGPHLLTACWRSMPDADVEVWPAHMVNPWIASHEGEPHPDSVCVHRWGHATPDEHLWGV